MAQVNDPRSPVASANGQWLLLRRAAYAAVGGQAAVRGAIAEDLALARRMKAAGARMRMAHAPELVHCRVYAGLPADCGAASARRSFPPPTAASPACSWSSPLLTLYGVAPWGRLLGGAGYALAGPARPRPGGRRGGAGLAHALAQLGPLARPRLDRPHLGLSPLYAFTYPLAVLLGDGLLLWSA